MKTVWIQENSVYPKNMKTRLSKQILTLLGEQYANENVFFNNLNVLYEVC